MMAHNSYFSVSFSMVVTGGRMIYDLYVNSSSIQDREKFVRIFKKGELLAWEDLQIFKSKYHQIYVAEADRSLFLKTLCDVKGGTVQEKTTVLKASAIHHLETLFDHEPTTEVLSQTLVGCRDVVVSMIDVLHDYNIDRLRELIASLSFHDFYTYDHSINVAMYSIMIYRALFPEASKNEIIQAGLGGLLHDLGKIKIPTEIINNSGKLSEEDFKMIQKHPGFGCELLTETAPHLPHDINTDLLSRVIGEHHENFDGTGYPNKISGNKISVMARITSIADFFDAVTTKRSYHEPMSPEDAIELMRKSVGKKLDPKLFEIFVERTQFMKTHRQLKRELPPDFDPCQPHAALPLIALGNVREIVNPDDFGKIKVIANKEEAKAMKDLGAQSNVQVIDLKQGKKEGTAVRAPLPPPRKKKTG